MSREFVAAARSFCEVKPTTLFAGTHQEPSWRGSSPRTIARSPSLTGIKVVDLAGGKPSRGAYEIAMQMETIGPYARSRFCASGVCVSNSEQPIPA